MYESTWKRSNAGEIRLGSIKYITIGGVVNANMWVHWF